MGLISTRMAGWGTILPLFGLPLLSPLPCLTIKVMVSRMFVHNTDYLKITSSVFADNYWGIFLHQDNEVSLENSRIVALSGNLGNPVDCDSGDDWASCRPVKGCK